MDNNADEEIARALNAVRQPGEALTCVVIESEAQARELVSRIANELGDRPYAQCAMVCSAARNGELLDEARQASGAWPQGEGVLFLLDETPIDVANEDRVGFWRAMNLQREHWAALTCHVIFLLKPGNYTLLISAADHLLSWMPLKFDVRRPAPDQPWLRMPRDMGGLRRRGESPREAAKTLAALEAKLGRALAEGEQSPVALARRFYLPMIEAALDAGNVGRADLLLRQVNADDLPDADLPRWYRAAFLTSIRNYRLNEAERAMRGLLDWAERHADDAHMAFAAYGLGTVAARRREYESAEAWYRKNIEIEKRLGDESAAATKVRELGVLARERRDFAVAEDRFRRSVEIQERLGDELEAGKTYRELGVLARARRDFESAKEWCGKAIRTQERLGDESGVAETCLELGTLAQERGDFESAEKWYGRATEIQERLGDESGFAGTCFEQGGLAQGRGDFESAERWHRKSLGIARRLGDELRVAINRGALGYLFARRGLLSEAAGELAQAAFLFKSFVDYPQLQGVLQLTLNYLAKVLSVCTDSKQKEIVALLAQHGLSLPEVASTPTDEKAPSEPVR